MNEMNDRYWMNLKMLSDDELFANVFEIFQRASLMIQERSGDDPELLGIIPRLLELLEERRCLNGFAEPLALLARNVGLWNYIDQSVADQRTALVKEATRVRVLDGISLHREQIRVLDKLLSGQNVILSAPTSFGKSLIIDAAISSGKFKRVAIVVPTIALLDEFRRRLHRRFHEKFDIIMHSSETSTRGQAIFVGTQERLINRSDIGKLDLVIVDEFYKLDPNRKDERSMTLNATVYRLLKKARQFFFIGPNIEDVKASEDGPWKFEFVKTRFATVAVNTYEIKDEANPLERLVELARDPRNWPVLVFVSSPERANEYCGLISKGMRVRQDASVLAKWMARNFGENWVVNGAVAKGIGVHHGRIPRALASRFVRMFNDGRMPILICTSTLIEGVNTSAKSVIIYDKKINRREYDFFTFSNIRGRAGRLGQHYVGDVFLFHTPPEQIDVEIDAPVFGESSEAPDEYIVYLDGEVDGSTQDRISQIATRLGLAIEDVRRLAGVGIQNLEKIKSSVEKSLRSSSALAWVGPGKWFNLLEVNKVICSARNPRYFGAKSARQLTLFMTKLMRLDVMKEFHMWHSETYKGNSLRSDEVFKFLRSCEYSLPEFYLAVETFVRAMGYDADYSRIIGELPYWFKPVALKNLEEQGVPFQISERFVRNDDDFRSLSRRLRRLAERKHPGMTPFERAWIIDAIPENL